jgi:hypothetical protein
VKGVSTFIFYAPQDSKGKLVGDILVFADEFDGRCYYFHYHSGFFGIHINVRVSIELQVK